MKTLIIAEKESQAKEFQNGLKIYGAFTHNQSGRYFESDEYIITWVQGHILGLKEPRDYENWGDRHWELEALPWYPPDFNFEHKVGNVRIYNQIKSVMSRKDISDIVIGTDAGREGTLIGQELIDHFGFKGKVRRYYDSASMSAANIQKVMNSGLKGDDFHIPRVKAAYARAYADLLLGMNFTIGFSAKAKTLLSMGRVKTPIMAILAQRKKEILEFKQETYFELEVDFDGVYKGTWFKDQLSNTKFITKEEIETMSDKVMNREGKIIKKEIVEENAQPGKLFRLSTLQGEASSKYGFNPSETLDIAQSLYDTHKILSYPRTESEVIGTDKVEELPVILEAVNYGQYTDFVKKIKEEGIPTTKRLVNDAELSDHHALIPTDLKADLSKLNDKEKKVFDLVVRRFLAAFYPAAKYEKTEVITEVENETFKTSGRIEIDKGWKVVYTDDENVDGDKNVESMIPPIEEGESRKVVEVETKEKKTTAPKLYTYKQLLSVMDNPKKFLNTKELKDALSSAESKAGLGTEATRAEILKELIERGYILEKGKSLDVTDFGMKLVEVCPDKLKSPEITAEWEGKLRQMEIGKYNFDDFMNEIQEYIEGILDELRAAEFKVSFKKGNLEGEEIAECPHCHSSIRDIGKIFVCENSKPEEKCFILGTEVAKKKITASHVKDLVNKGETKIIKGFVAKSGKKFDAKLKLNGKNVEFNFDKDAISSCPYCQTDISNKGKVYTCETHKPDNPCFIVFSEIAKKKISDSIVKQLAEKGETSIIKGFTGSKGLFDAKLKIGEDKKVSFKFENSKTETKQTDLKCPFCGEGNISENAKAFSCTNWKNGCKFTVWKNGKVINKDVIEKLIADGETGKLNKLKKQNGDTYSANLKLDKQNKKVITEYIND